MKSSTPLGPIEENATGWRQQKLFGASELVLELRVGVVMDADHCQAQYTIRDPEIGELVAMRSWPHYPLSCLHSLLTVAAGVALEDLEELLR